MGAAAFMFMPKSMEGHTGLMAQIAKRLDKVILDSSYAVINPSEDPAVTNLLQVFPRPVQNWFLRRVQSFENKSEVSMKLPVPLPQLFPAEQYAEAGLFKENRLLILHGKNDTRTSYDQSEKNLSTLIQHGYNAILKTLNADHFVTNWKPSPNGKKEYMATLRDEEHYVKLVREFLKEKRD